MPSETHDVTTLNSLLSSVVDSIDGFHQAESAVDTGVSGAARSGAAMAARAKADGRIRAT